MKFRDPKTGEVFEDIEKVRRVTCGSHVCSLLGNCPLRKAVQGHNCVQWCSENPAKAARLMGYEVVEENELIRNTGFHASTDTRKEDKPMNKPSKQDVMEALHVHGNPCHECELCPYQQYDGCSAKLARDALELLEEVMEE